MNLSKEELEKFILITKKIKSDLAKSLIIEYNPHAPYFEPIEREIGKLAKFPSKEIRQKCIKDNHVWLLQYWNTSVGHIDLGDYDFENLIKRFLKYVEIKHDVVDLKRE